MAPSLTPDDIVRLADELLARSRSEPLPLDQFEARIVAYYRSKDRAPATIAKLRQAIGLVRGLPGVATTGDLTFETMVRFLESRREKSPITTCSLLSSVRAACSFAVDMGYLRSSPFTGRRNKLFPRRGAPRREKRHHSREEIARVLRLLRSEAESAGDEPGAWRAWRLYALFALLIYTGVRKMEALRLQVRDVEPFARVLRVVPRVRLKTEESARVVPLPPELVPILAAWLPRTGCEWAFPGIRRGCPWVHGGPGQRPLDHLREAGRRAGVEGLTFQACRHSYATHGRFYGISREMMREILGHTSERTQEHYLEDDVADLRETVERVSYLAG